MLVVVSALPKSLTLFETTNSPSFPPENYVIPTSPLKKNISSSPPGYKNDSFFSIAANPEIKPETTKLP